jgi:tryptophanyl-tRNA synthetase
MTQFKEKSGKHKERSSVGLYTYPVLQAADILAYKATHVPVGDDQRQHLELTRDIAAKFNHDFEAPNFFPLPDALTQGPGARVMSLRDGQAKMSKSDPSDLSRINLTDDADAISQKIRKARTDPEPLPDTLEALGSRAEAANLVGIYAALAETTSEAVLQEFAGQGFGAFKPKLADLAVARLGPVSEAMRRYLADPAEIDRVLKDGAARARTVAGPKRSGWWDSWAPESSGGGADVLTGLRVDEDCARLELEQLRLHAFAVNADAEHRAVPDFHAIEVVEA